MKKAGLILLCALMVLTFIVSAQSDFSPKNVPPSPYQDLLRRYKAFILANGATDAGEQDFTGVEEALNWMKVEGALSGVGYLEKDITGDGVPELIIGAVPGTGTQTGADNAAYAVYTLVSGRPQLVFEGWERNRYRYLGNGRFFNQGSNGAMYSIFGTYALSSNGQSLQNEEYFFTYDKANQGMGLYRNTTGQWDPAVSEELKITESAFWQIEKRMENQIVRMNFIPLKNFDH